MTKVPIDVHLMVKPVDRIVPDFAKAGRRHHQLSSRGDRARRPHDRADPRAAAARPGWCSIPATPLDYLDHVHRQARPGADHVGQPGLRRPEVHPAGAGQAAPSARGRIDAEPGATIWLEVDGGVKVDNIAEIARAGADTFVAGSAIFGAQGLQGDDRGDARRARQGCDARDASASPPHRELCAASAPNQRPVASSRDDRPRRHAARHRSRSRGGGRTRCSRELGPAPLAPRRSARASSARACRIWSQRSLAATRCDGRAPTRRCRRRAARCIRRTTPSVTAAHARSIPACVEGLDALRAMRLPLACVTNKADALHLPLLEQSASPTISSWSSAATRCRTKKPDPLPLLHVCARLRHRARAAADGRRLGERRAGGARRRLPGVAACPTATARAGRAANWTADAIVAVAGCEAATRLIPKASSHVRLDTIRTETAASRLAGAGAAGAALLAPLPRAWRRALARLPYSFSRCSVGVES